MLNINTNTQSLNTQRSLNKSQNSLAISLQRLSSGMRVNSAKDDAAGLAIGERMTSQIRGMNVAARNANDGISLLSVADGGLRNVTDNIQRIRELAVQSANATYSASDREAMQAEVSQLVESSFSVVDQAKFNLVPLFDGNYNSSFQIGANVGDTLPIALPKILTRGQTITTPDTTVTTVIPGGNVWTNLVATPTAPLSNGDLILNGTPIGATVAGAVPGQTADSAWAIANAIMAANVADLRVVGSAADGGGTSGLFIPSVSGSTFLPLTETIAAGAITINGVPIGTISSADDSPPNTVVGFLRAAITQFEAVPGTLAGLGGDLSGGTSLYVSGTVGNNIDIQETIPGSLAKLGLSAGVYRGRYTLDSSYVPAPGIPIVVSGNHPEYAGLSAGTFPANDSSGGGGTTVTTTIPGTTTTIPGDPESDVLIAWADAKIASVSSTRAYIGATSNRLDSVISNSQINSENLSAARSRIVDADYAAETAELTRNQVMQQAGLAMLAQANQLPQQVLSLLKG